MGKINKKQRNQLIGFFGAIIIVFAIFLGTYFYIQSLKHFEYAGVKWQINKKSPEPYHGILSTFYNPNLAYNIYLRVDPRKNNVTITNTSFAFYKNVTIAIDPETGNCQGVQLPVYKLAAFLKQYGGISSKSAVTNKTVAQENNIDFADCSSAINKTVVLLRNSDTPRIFQEGDCYIIEVGKCETIPATEKFMTAVLAQVNEVKI